MHRFPNHGLELRPQPVWEADARGALVSLSKPWVEYTGLSIDETLARGWECAVHPEDVLALPEERARVFDRSEPIALRVRVRRHDGVWRWNELRGAPVLDRAGTLRWIGVLEDVEVGAVLRASDERRRTELALATVGEITRTLAEPGPLEPMLARFARAITHHLADACSIHVRDVLGHVRCVAAAEAGTVEPVTRRLDELLRDDDLAVPPHGLHHVLRTGSADLVSEVTPELLASIAKNHAAEAVLEALGTRSWVIAPLVTDGVVTGALVVEHRGRSYEATDRAIVEELARRAGAAIETATLLDEAQRANQLKDEFLSVASHELRTPLSTILGWSKLLRDDPNPTLDRVKKGLDVIHRNATAQARLVDDILDTSRILRNKVALDLKTVAIGGPLEEALESLRATAAERGLELVVDLDPDAIGKADTTRLRQIFYNLLSNALKFTPKGGKVVARVAREPGAVVASIRDTGAGIDPAYLPYLFERFRQADASPTRKHGGLGLGLAIASKLVALHGGTLSASSEGLGHGATFTVRLPSQLSRAEPGTSPSISIVPRGARAADLGGLRVLLVDDHDDARDLYGSVLSLRGARVTTAPSAAHARERLAESRFDVLVSDIAMPGEDGRSLATFARSHHPAMRRIAISAFSQPEDLSRAHEAGFERYLVKPVDTHELVSVVAELAVMARPATT